MHLLRSKRARAWACASAVIYFMAISPTTLCPSRPQGTLGDDDKMRASTRNIARRSFLTMTSDSLLKETFKGCGGCTATDMGGQGDPAVLDVRLS